MISVDIESSARSPYVLHFLSMFALGFALFESQLLEINIACIEDGAGIARVGSFLAHETSKLRRLYVAGLLLGGVTFKTGEGWCQRKGKGYTKNLLQVTYYCASRSRQN